MKKNNYALRITNFALVNPTPPTPPTPPTIDKGDGVNNNHAKIDAKQLLGIRKEDSEKSISDGNENISEEVDEKSPPPVVGKREVTTPETMARDAVANGAGPLTKRTVEREQDRGNRAEGTERKVQEKRPPSLNFAMTEEDKGKEVLKQFQRDENISAEQKNSSTTEAPRIVKLNSNEGHGGFYWAVALALAVVLAVVFVKKFLITDKPKLKKSDLFEGSNKKLKNVSEKISKPAKNYQPNKPVNKKIPKPEDDDKGKHFEVRV